jgi:hypothetical protein
MSAMLSMMWQGEEGGEEEESSNHDVRATK